ncbi:MAG: AmmeMemoRadiSam system protein B [Nitrospirae bacterium]|nr:AmmeMemoRadiSam system protein B [Nitrospirota bacterium]
MKREAAAAGQFYNGTASMLKREVEGYIIADAPKEKAIGIISPHAGFMYSGHVAGAVYSSIQTPKTFLLIGPNHTGLGASVSIMISGEWEIPIGVISVDEKLGRDIKEHVPCAIEDIQAHMFEHSLEVQLPFIRYFSDAARIVPMTVMRASIKECEEIGKGIAESIRNVDYEVVIAASSDMSHYVPDKTARELDNLAIREIINMSPEGLYKTVKEKHISMCGYLPAVIMLYAAKALGAKEARLVKYATSGDVSGDYRHVVGYAGVIVK